MKKKNQQGITMVEMFVVVSVFTIIVAAVSIFFSDTRNKLTYFEATNQLKSLSQKVLNSINDKLVVSKRLFENSTEDNMFLTKLEMTDCPSLKTGSKLPTITENGSISPNSAGFDPATTGNSLLFLTSSAPFLATVQTGTATITNTFRINLYRFNYYYLSEDSSQALQDKSTRLLLYYWRSLDYADYSQTTNITAIADSTAAVNVGKALFDEGISRAFDTSSRNVSNCFYTIDSGGALSLSSNHVIAQQTCNNVIKMTTGILGWTLRYGISYNTNASRVTVPIFAAASGDFPGGFEVVAVGPSGGRQVFIRIVLCSMSAAGTNYMEQPLLVSLRDIW
jgi:type II secretory pathway pseudopilin PulG